MPPDTPPMPQRHLKFAGTYNFRDTGGYPACNGGTTRRILFRSDSPHRLSETDRTSLFGDGLRTAIDLRQAEELAEAPNAFAASAHVTYHHVPLLSAVPAPPEVLPALVDICRSILDDRGEQVGVVLAMLVHLKKRYGGIKAYVRTTGLGDAEIDRLQRAMVA